MKSRYGIQIEDVAPGSPASNEGIRAGDILLKVNGQGVRDVIDYMFESGAPELNLTVSRKGRKHDVSLSLLPGEDAGIELRQFKVKICRNKCIFCFVAQLPKGLRRTLYVKDEDYRMSFLYGNYVTLTNLSPEDKKRIVRQRLSPLYISVHTTNRELRAKMLGNERAPDIMKELKFLKDNKIRMHAQIVLCPGLNDGQELRRTIRDLYSFYPHMESLAVVPVGLTAHSKSGLKPVAKEDAERALDIIESFQRRFTKKHGDPIVYGADELYIKAGRPMPPLREYGELPQIENGVGMVQHFMTTARRLRITDAPKTSRRYVTFTGVSFHPFLKRFIARLNKHGMDIALVPVENTFFGSSVTVTGLLTGRDVLKSLQDRIGEFDVLLVPDVVLKECDSVFLDDVEVKDLGRALSVEARIINSSPEGLLEGVAES